MAEIHIQQRKKTPMWVWVIVLVALAIITWIVVKAFNKQGDSINTPASKQEDTEIYYKRVSNLYYIV